MMEIQHLKTFSSIKDGEELRVTIASHRLKVAPAQVIQTEACTQEGLDFSVK